MLIFEINHPENMHPRALMAAENSLTQMMMAAGYSENSLTFNFCPCSRATHHFFTWYVTREFSMGIFKRLYYWAIGNSVQKQAQIISDKVAKIIREQLGVPVEVLVSAAAKWHSAISLED